MSILVISSSLSPDSKSRIVANEMNACLKSAGANPEFIDLRKYPMPFCDASQAYGDPNVIKLSKKIKDASGIIIAFPIYNYDSNGVLKNLLELTGKSWQNKVVGFACAAGGPGSYMAPMSMANSLMLDFRCIIIPRFVYVMASQINQEGVLPDVKIRIVELAETVLSFVQALEVYIKSVEA